MPPRTTGWAADAPETSSLRRHPSFTEFSRSHKNKPGKHLAGLTARHFLYSRQVRADDPQDLAIRGLYRPHAKPFMLEAGHIITAHDAAAVNATDMLRIKPFQIGRAHV